jgi:hypothetical protein
MTQLGSIYGGVDLPCKNYGGSDIGPGLGVLIDTGNLAGPDAAPGVVLPTNSGGVVGTLGITVETIYAGKVGRVRVAGAYPVVAHGSVTAGTYVQLSDTTAHLGQVKTCLSATEQIGQALNGASDGDPVLVLICKAKNA